MDFKEIIHFRLFILSDFGVRFFHPTSRFKSRNGFGSLDLGFRKSRVGEAERNPPTEGNLEYRTGN